MLSTFEPVATIFLAALIFGDRVGGMQILGTGCIIVSALILSLMKKSVDQMS